jgi:hypothetical protein
MYRQIRHSFDSPTFQTDSAVRRYLHTITLNQFLKNKQSETKAFDSHIAQIR